MQINQLIVSLTFLFALLFAGRSDAAKGMGHSRDQIPDFAKPAWDATVKIEGISRSGYANVENVGTGVIIGYDAKSGVAKIATNHHVLFPEREGTGDRRHRVEFYDADGEGQITFEVTVASEEKSPFEDLAILYAHVPKKAKFEVARLKRPHASQIGEDVVAIGYPQVSKRSSKDWGDLKPANFGQSIKRFSKGKIKDVTNYPFYRAPLAFLDGLSIGNPKAWGESCKSCGWLVVPVIKHDADTLPGNSGGPLVAQDGSIVALNRSINIMVTYAAPADESDRDRKRRESLEHDRAKELHFKYCGEAMVSGARVQCDYLGVASHCLGERNQYCHLEYP